MFTATLDRAKFATLSIVDARADLATQAASTLGYTKLINHIKAPGRLLSALRTLDIQPFTLHSVKRYKASKEYTGWYSGTKQMLALMAAFVTVVSCFGTGIHRAVKLHEVPDWLYAINCATCLLGLGLIFWTIGWTIEGGRWGHGNRKVRQWRQTTINMYYGTVPEFALDRAIRIKSLVPEATVGIDYLVCANEHKERPMRDPFLYVELGNELYYVDVWNEREYEAKL